MANDREKPKPTTSDAAAGRVEIDARGRNVWQWNGEQIDSTTIMLSRLENDELELEPTRSVPVPGGKPGNTKAASDGEPDLEATFNVKSGGGFDPYNRS